MANIRSLTTFGFLVALGTGPSIAMPPREIPAEVKACDGGQAELAAQAVVFTLDSSTTIKITTIVCELSFALPKI
jgi:hypothetical protein